MRAMVLDKPGQPLQLRDVPKPRPGRGQLLVRINTCAVCRTDLHVVDSQLPNPKLPLILGHQIVGRVEEVGGEMWEGTERPDSRGTRVAPTFAVGHRVGIPWLGWTDGECAFCRSGRENLCDRPRFTGYTIDGGYAEFTVVDARFCFHLPVHYNDVEAAPLLCAGLIGYRSYRKTGDARCLGMYGFGNAAHLIAQIALYEGRDLFVFTRLPPEELDAAIIFASVGPLLPAALRALAKGGIVVCAGIHMTDIPSFAYADLWEERVITSVANLTRRDGEEFFEIAPRVPVRTLTETFPLEEANVALDRFRTAKLKGTAVLVVNPN